MASDTPVRSAPTEIVEENAPRAQSWRRPVPPGNSHGRRIIGVRQQARQIGGPRRRTRQRRCAGALTWPALPRNLGAWPQRSHAPEKWPSCGNAVARRIKKEIIAVAGLLARWRIADYRGVMPPYRPKSPPWRGIDQPEESRKSRRIMAEIFISGNEMRSAPASERLMKNESEPRRWHR